MPEPDLSLVQWIAKQCRGIAQALRKIHRSDSDGPGSGHRDYGIHSDLKPENTLWFDDREDKHGILVICDFGFTRFHGRDSRSKANPVGVTDTYRAPEVDLGGGISRAYDVWTLACLYLEFTTWYLTGYKGVQNFAKKRVHGDQNGIIPGDTFFNFNTMEGVSKLSAIIKPSVLEVSSIQMVTSLFPDVVMLTDQSVDQAPTESRTLQHFFP